MRDSVARAISRWIVGSSNYACINIPSFNVELFPSINLYFNLRCIMQGGARLKFEKGKSSFCTRLVGRKCRYDSFFAGEQLQMQIGAPFKCSFKALT